MSTDLDSKDRVALRKRARRDAKARRRTQRAFLKNLRLLGFNSYDGYLASNFWRAIRERVFAVKGRICVHCGKPAEQVHHSRYDLATLRGDDLTYLHPVCFESHQWAEKAPARQNEPRGKLDRANVRLGVDE